MKTQQPKSFVVMLDGGVPPGPFRCCALVGSSPILHGRRLGAEIDRFDTVIRVNRIPSPSYVVDWGTKTDIAFINDQHWFRPEVKMLGEVGSRKCTAPGVCNFTVILSSWQPRRARVWRNVSDAWRNARCRVGHEVESVGDSLRRYLPLKPGGRDHWMPSGGMHAFFTLVTQCAYTRIYGFGGSQASADGHVVSEFHNFAAEREVMRMVAHGDRRSIARRTKTARDKWQVGPPWMEDLLAELRGRISFAG